MSHHGNVKIDPKISDTGSNARALDLMAATLAGCLFSSAHT